MQIQINQEMQIQIAEKNEKYIFHLIDQIKFMINGIFLETKLTVPIQLRNLYSLGELGVIIKENRIYIREEFTRKKV